MATTEEIQTALANEARRSELKQSVSKLKGTASATASLMSMLNTMNNDTNVSLAAAQAQLAALEEGAGPGVTADFGVKSIVTQFLETERAAAKSACIDFVKANPECTEEEAADAWDQAAADSHPALPFACQPGLAMGWLYRTNLLARQLIQGPTWEAQREWILVTPKEVIMAS